MKTKTISCKYCQKEHTYPLREYNHRTRNGLKPREYCSRECRVKDTSAATDTRECVVCHTEFTALTRHKKRKCCSKECANKIRRRNPNRNKDGNTRVTYTPRECANPRCNNEASYCNGSNSKHQRVLCDTCIDEGRQRFKGYDYYLPNELCLGDCVKRGGANTYDKVRYWSRKLILESDREMKCEECGYDKHVEVAHIKAISDYSNDTLIATINDHSNLKILCPNCHWEFDNL